MIMGRDSCEIVPETPVMKEVKEIQQRIAREGIKFLKAEHLLLNEFVKEDGVWNDCEKMMSDTAFFTTEK